MSRQIISYSDLGPITSTRSPNPPGLSPDRVMRAKGDDEKEEPPRKRQRTDADSPAHPNASAGSEEISNFSLSQANSAKTGSKGKGKKPPRPGNPGGVPWSRHWDANGTSEASQSAILAYGDDAEETGASSPINSTTAASTKTVMLQASPNLQLSGNPPLQHSFVEHPNNLAGSSQPSKNAKQKTANEKPHDKKKHKDKAKVGQSLPMGAEEWDDSSLIDAWNAAEEEYRLMNGGKKWRCEPVKHSSLWHDKAASEAKFDSDYSDTDGNSQGTEAGVPEVMQEITYFQQDSASTTAIPVDVAHFPHFKPSFSFNPASLSQISTRAALEEAFLKAQEATYAQGYWAAMFHFHASQVDTRASAQPAADSGKLIANGAEIESLEQTGANSGSDVEDEDPEDNEAEFLATQR